MEKSLITIGITCFNSQKNIEKAVRSALNQSWRPIEIIIVDDHSIDNSFKILKELEKKNSLISVYRNKFNRGVAYSRNKIIQNAKGDFIAFFDDDDESLPDRIKEQYIRIVDYEKSFARNKFVICHCARIINYYNKKIFFENSIGENYGFKAPSGIEVAQRILYGKPLNNAYGSLPTCSQMARLSTYKNLGGFDIFFKRSEDTEFIIRCAKEGSHFVGIKKALVNQYMTKTKDKNFEIEIFYFKAILKKHNKLLTKKQFDFANNWLDLKNLYFQSKFKELMVLLIYCFVAYPKYSFFRFYLGLRNLTKNMYYFKFHKDKY